MFYCDAVVDFSFCMYSSYACMYIVCAPTRTIKKSFYCSMCTCTCLLLITLCFQVCEQNDRLKKTIKAHNGEGAHTPELVRLKAENAVLQKSIQGVLCTCTVVRGITCGTCTTYM